MEFVRKSRAIDTDGFSAVTQSLKIKAAEIWAVLAVETTGCGFLPDRRPKILFERHYFHDLTKGKFDKKAPDISAPTAGGYGAGGAHQYDRLAQAIQLDRAAALRSASWGLGQVMGDNFKSAGFKDVETMVAAMCDSESAQLAAVGSFLKANKLDRALQAHDWTAFARGYNGPDFAENKYDIQLRGEFQKYSFGSLPDLNIRAAQVYLNFLGFDPGRIDGVMGSHTRSALVDFQTKQKLTVTGKLDDATVAALEKAALT
jgi:N-acetylmuramidase-like protein/putative peptidoglycan binding protein